VAVHCFVECKGQVARRCPITGTKSVSCCAYAGGTQAECHAEVFAVIKTYTGHQTLAAQAISGENNGVTCADTLGPESSI
jgi:hypothetical protein